MRTNIDQESFNEWCLQLDAYLCRVGVETRVYHFRMPALLYGYIVEMAPDAFLRDGWDRDVAELSVWSEGAKKLSLRTYLDFSRSRPASVEEDFEKVPLPHRQLCPVCGASDWRGGNLNSEHRIRFREYDAGFFNWGFPVVAHVCMNCGYLALSCPEMVGQ